MESINNTSEEEGSGQELNQRENENLPANEATDNETALEDNTTEKPLPKIHPNLHYNGKYRMFSNHSSANDIPGTSTGI